MKAINYFVLNILALGLLVSCKPQEQEQHDLDPSTKSYFEVRDQSKFIFTDAADTNISITYVSSNFNNNRANPDIENSEIMFYDLKATGQPTYTIRCQSGGNQFKDQIAMITNINDSNFIGPVIFNLGGTFSAGMNSGDSVFQYPSRNIGGLVFTDVLRVKMLSHQKYKEVYFAKNIGLVARLEKNNKLFFVKRYSKS